MSSKNEERRRKAITIRGIDKDLYDRILVLARETGKTVGELLNEAMKLLLIIGPVALRATSRVAQGIISASRAITEGVVEGFQDVIEVSGVDELVVTRSDLEQVEKPLVFKLIKRLEFADDIPYELFVSKVKAIILCNEVLIPSTYPKLKVVNICRMVRRIITKTPS
ncbi:MAG: hypothetical protein DRO15_02185 [Thermoprotei archaeon]|nr:MAG: hypothetical protein DRO15_02185 [Thermoprotei archaeon]